MNSNLMGLKRNILDIRNSTEHKSIIKTLCELKDKMSIMSSQKLEFMELWNSFHYVQILSGVI